MRLPEVVSTETESISDEEHAALIAATEAAAARLDAFRMQEGAILIADLLGRVDRIESYKEEVVPFEKARTETIKAGFWTTSKSCRPTWTATGWSRR